MRLTQDRSQQPEKSRSFKLLLGPGWVRTQVLSPGKEKNPHTWPFARSLAPDFSLAKLSTLKIISYDSSVSC